MDPSDYAGDDRLVVAFEKHDEFVQLLKEFLTVDLLAEPTPPERAAEERLLLKLTGILDEYQEAAYLLDPYLEELVGPPIELLRSYASHVAKTGSLESTVRLGMLARLIYWYTKTRGYKTIVRYFPHETADFTLVLHLLLKVQEASEVDWEVTYVLLLWLSLICMLPFNLSLFDEKGKEPIGDTLERIGMLQLGKAGKERDAAAVLLSKLYIRKDAEDRIKPFFCWGSQMVEAQDTGYATLGFLQVIAELLKSGTHAALSVYLPDIRQLLDTIREQSALMRNTLVRKYCSKISCRLAVMQLPLRSAPKTARTLRVEDNSASQGLTADHEEEVDIPETLDEHVEELVTFLQDKDTVVRYSAAKGLARISERLPTEFANQVLDTILGLYAPYEEAVRVQEYVPDAEGSWHGATLACAEFARRGLIKGEHFAQVIEWAKKALLFDIRKGAVSVGSNVRDAAAYVIWASARSQNVEAMRHLALSLSQRLVAVSVFDREITIRRAASAAFQENVGRLSLFPHGIDVLRKTDFYAVSVRRNAFEVAAPEVAEHLEYRDSLLEHLEKITLRHWDPHIRSLAATSSRRICELDLTNLGPDFAARQEKLLTNPESTIVHGALLALASVAEAMSSRSQPGLREARLQIFRSIEKVPLRKLQSFRGELLLGAVCSVVATSVSQEALAPGSGSPAWKKILELGLTSRDDSVQDAAADAWSSISGLTWVKEFPKTTPTIQQGIAKALGKLKYAAYAHGVRDVMQCLGNALTTVPPLPIEVKRDCFAALTEIVNQDGVIVGQDDRIDLFHSFLSSVQDGLKDYTTDQRGDVGSWVRMECLKALGAVISGVFQACERLHEPPSWISQGLLINLMGMTLKQGVERLDNIRDEAGIQLGKILSAYKASSKSTTIWTIEGEVILQELCYDKHGRTWKEGPWLFPKIVELIPLPAYRPFLLEGLSYGIGSKTESTLGPAGQALSDFARDLPVSAVDRETFSLYKLTKDLVVQAQNNFSSNVYFIPYLQVFLVLLQTDVLQRLAETEEGEALLKRIVDLAGRNASRLKNVQRIIISMKIITSIAAIPTLTSLARSPLMTYLTHSVPTVRAETAESLYLISQTSEIFGEETDKAEELLLETQWLNGDTNDIGAAASELLQLMKSETHLTA